MSNITNTIKTLLPFTHRYSIDFVDSAFSITKNNTTSRTSKAPKVIYTFWTEDNPLSKNREHSIDTIKQNCDVEFKLITKRDLSAYELKEHPFHEAFKYLSAVHKSDYLRTYFMHFYGGGYTDIKPHSNSWTDLFDKLNNSPSFLCLGYPEKSPKDLAHIRHFIHSGNKKKLNHHLQKYYHKIIGNGSYIFKPKTQFTELWLHECERRLTLAFKDLKEHPGNIYGDNPGYPLAWTSILGQIFHPLCLAFNENMLRDEKIRPICENYR